MCLSEFEIGKRQYMATSNGKAALMCQSHNIVYCDVKLEFARNLKTEIDGKS